MSVSESPVVSIGAECGGPEARFVAGLKIPLFLALTKHVKSSHCAAIEEYGVVLRIDGSLAQYGEEGLARIRFAKAQRYITVDIQIPQAVWSSLDNTQLKIYLAGQVRSAVEACISRIKKERIEIDEKQLLEQVNAAICEYLGSQSG